LPVAFQARRLRQPPLEVALHARPAAPGPYVSRTAPRPRPDQGDDGDLELGRPASVGLEPDLEGEALLVDPRRSRRRDDRCAPIRLALVAEQQPTVLDPGRVLSLLLERVLDLEEVGEVAAGLDADGQVDRLLVVVQDRQLLGETSADGATA